jgi:hypothetical protein
MRRLGGRLTFAIVFRRGLMAVVASSGLAFLSPASAQAASVTVGSPLTASFSAGNCLQNCTFVNLSLPEPGAMVTSPVNGTIVRWRIIGGAPMPGYAIRVVHPAGGSSYSGAGTSTLETPTGAGLQTYTTILPIHAGDLVGLNVPAGGVMGPPPLHQQNPEVGSPRWRMALRSQS